MIVNLNYLDDVLTVYTLFCELQDSFNVTIQPCLLYYFTKHEFEHCQQITLQRILLKISN